MVPSPRQLNACGSGVTGRCHGKGYCFFLPPFRQLNPPSSSIERRYPPTPQPNACGSSIREGFLPVFNSMLVGPALRKGFFLLHPRQIDSWGSSTRGPPPRQPNACGSSIREEFLLPPRQPIACGSSITKRVLPSSSSSNQRVGFQC